MEVKHIRYVAAIAQTSNFSKAAEQLYISQSSLSQHIARLEDEIGYPLFLRSTKRVQLSPQGRHFLAQGERVLREFSLLEQQIQDVREASEHTINMGVSVIYRPETSKQLACFMAENPQINLHFISAWELELLELLRRGRMDLALFGVDQTHDDLSGLTIIPLRKEWVVVAISPRHRLSRKKHISLDELVEENLIFTSEQSGVRNLALHSIREKGLTPTRIMDINEAETRIDYVRRNIGIAVAMSSAHHWLQCEDVLKLPVEPRLHRTYSIIMPNHSPCSNPHAVSLLQEFLLTHLGD